MNSGRIEYHRHGNIATIDIDGDEGNRFSPLLRSQFNLALKTFRDDPDAWIVVVSSTGEDFCLGGDDSLARSKLDERERSRLWAGGYVEVWKPIIGAFQGRCIGEGFGVALACDLRVAEEGTRFSTGTPESTTDMDVLAAWLISLVGLSTAFELLWLGREIDGRTAQRYGLVNRLAIAGSPGQASDDGGRFPMQPMRESIKVPDGSARTAAMEYAAEILQYAPVTRNFQKETALRSVGVPFHYAQTLELGPNPYASEDRIEGTRAFVEDRRPIWRNR